MNSLHSFLRRQLRFLFFVSWLLPSQVGWCGGVITNCTQADLQTALAGGGEVAFVCSGTILLTNTLVITQDTTIDGSGFEVTLSGGGAVRLFAVTNAVLNLSGLTLADGSCVGTNGVLGASSGQEAGGACILNQGGTVNLTGCLLTNYLARGGNAQLVGRFPPAFFGSGGNAYGGAICSLAGQLNLTNCLVVNCVASGGFGGAWGIGADGFACGGALYADNPAQVTLNGWVSQTATLTYTNPCTFTLSATNASFSAAQQLAAVMVLCPDTNCPWTVVNPCDWISVTNGSPGSPVVFYRVSANDDSDDRNCTLTIAGLPFTVTQAGKCVFSLDSSGTNIGPGAMSGCVAVTTRSNCAWTAVRDCRWLHTTNTGVGPGVVWYTADSNPSILGRQCTLSVGGVPFTVIQEGRCMLSLSAHGANIGSGAQSGFVIVNTQSNCTWTAVTHDTWLHTTNTGTGPGLVGYSVDANSSTNSRTGTIDIRGEVFTVVQAGLNPVFTKGTYHGLFYPAYPATGADWHNIGALTLSTTRRRTFTGRLSLEGARHSFQGQFDLSGDASLAVSRRGKPALVLTLHLEGAKKLAGTVAEQGGGWQASLEADRAVFAASHPCDYAGLYTFVLLGADGRAALPRGDGHGTLKVNARGGATAALSLADGTTFIASSVIAEDGRLPLFGALYQGKGLVSTWVQLPADATNYFFGVAFWIKPPGLRVYSDGFNVTVPSLTMKYTVPVHEPVFHFTDGSVFFGGGDLPEAVSFPVKLVSNTKMAPVGGSNLWLSISASSGKFSGSFSVPPAKERYHFRGILARGVLEPQLASGFGYFLGTNQSGYVCIWGQSRND